MIIVRQKVVYLFLSQLGIQQYKKGKKTVGEQCTIYNTL